MTPSSLAFCDKANPQNASASTVTLITFFLFLNAERQCSIAAIGFPVHSTIISIDSWETSASQLSEINVLPHENASDRLEVSKADGSQPTISIFDLAFSGCISTTPTI